MICFPSTFGLMMKDCVISLLGDIYLRGKSFDSAPQEEHVGSFCVAHSQIVFDSFPDKIPDAGPGWSHP